MIAAVETNEQAEAPVYTLDRQTEMTVTDIDTDDPIIDCGEVALSSFGRVRNAPVTGGEPHGCIYATRPVLPSRTLSGIPKAISHRLKRIPKTAFLTNLLVN
jgi:hypothetical protein